MKTALGRTLTHRQVRRMCGSRNSRRAHSNDKGAISTRGQIRRKKDEMRRKGFTII